MALSCLLRGTLQSCRVRPSLAISPKTFAISSVTYHKLPYQEKSVSTPNKIPLSLLDLQKFPVIQKYPMSSSHADHAKLWTLEKLFSLGLLGIVPMAIAFPNVLFDLLMAVGMVMHAHWGIEAIVMDYIRPTIFGSIIPKVAHLMVYVLTVGLLVGLLNLIFNNVGLGNSIRLIWKI